MVVKVLRAVLVLGVDVLGWVVLLVLGAGCGVLGCLTAGPDWVALEGRLLDRGRICNTYTPTRTDNTISGSDTAGVSKLKSAYVATNKLSQIRLIVLDVHIVKTNYYKLGFIKRQQKFLNHNKP